MYMTSSDTVAEIQFDLKWKSESAAHTDSFFGQNVNFWRDIFPKELYSKLINRFAGDDADVYFGPGTVIPLYDPCRLFDIKTNQFDRRFRPDGTITPRQGRFYPKGILNGICNVFKANIEPFRCAGLSGSSVSVDFNHPLAGMELRLQTKIKDIKLKPYDRGGSCTDWIETVTQGPGMQARWRGSETDFFSDNPFARTDEGSDRIFYGKPRFVNHIDETAIRVITGLYGNHLRQGINVLDLMSGWKSHLPQEMEFSGVTGLGMNEEELKKNSRLTSYLVHDLNMNPKISLDDDSFDAAVCTVSVEYLVRPFEVFEEVARILKKGAPFVITFSNRWFPPKAIKIWREIHEFERMGLILEYFMRSGKYRNLETYSLRGLPRPLDDKYYPEIMHSDPVYCVWGNKA